MLRRALLALALVGLSLPALAQSNDPSFRVVNNSRHIVNEIYASASNERNWGSDRLGNDVIAPGANYIVRLPAGECVYDIRIVYQGGMAEERRRVNTCALTDLPLPLIANAPAGGSPQQQQARPPQQQQQQQARPPQQQQQAAPGPQTGNPSFNLVNQSGRVIEEFYASPGSSQDWGSDRLGDDVVQPGQSYPIRLPQGECTYDLRAVFQGGGTQERRGVNTCTLDNYVVR